jgi:hypothetical protein
MGHALLGELPDTAPWRKVVELIAAGAFAADVAQATIQAAEKGLLLATDDRGLSYAVYLLSQIVLASRSENFAANLNLADIRVQAEPTTLDVVAAFTEAVDRQLWEKGGRTDLGEMAQLAAVETLTSQVSIRSGRLYGTSAADVKDSIREMSTRAGFARFYREFFARFTQRFLTYHLGRQLSLHVGGPNERFANLEQHNEFLGRLRTHCREAALIVQEFAGDWYSKAHFEGGITQGKARGFVNKCLDKLRKELLIRGRRDV